MIFKKENSGYFLFAGSKTTETHRFEYLSVITHFID